MPTNALMTTPSRRWLPVAFSHRHLIPTHTQKRSIFTVGSLPLQIPSLATQEQRTLSFRLRLDLSITIYLPSHPHPYLLIYHPRQLSVSFFSSYFYLVLYPSVSGVVASFSLRLLWHLHWRPGVGYTQSLYLLSESWLLLFCFSFSTQVFVWRDQLCSVVGLFSPSKHLSTYSVQYMYIPAFSVCLEENG